MHNACLAVEQNVTATQLKNKVVFKIVSAVKLYTLWKARISVSQRGYIKQ